MKSINLLSILFLTSFVFFSSYSSAQCSGIDKLVEKCNKQLGDYRYQKQFEFYISGDKKDTEISYSLNITQGVTYKFTLAGSPKYKVEPIISILHKTQKFLIASNYDEDTEKTYSSIEFESQTTATVIVKFNFPSNGEGCGSCVLGIKTR